MRRILRPLLRRVSARLPVLRRAAGRFGIGQWLAPKSTREIVRIDGDVMVELDLGVPLYRYLYFNYDLADIPEIPVLRRLLGAGDVYVDVGAHIGYTCLVGAKYAKRAIAFEPSPTSFAYLQRNIALNPGLRHKIDARCLGLSSARGSVSLFNSRSQPGLAATTPIAADDVYVEHIQVDTLSDQLADLNDRVALIKIDVEGAELDVLRGAEARIVRDAPCILIELLEAHQRRFGRSSADVLGYFADLGYAVFDLRRDARGYRLAPIEATPGDELTIELALAVPRARHAEIANLLSSDGR